MAQANIKLGGFAASVGVGMKTNGIASTVNGSGVAASGSVKIDSSVSTVRNASAKDSNGNFSPNQDYATLIADLTRRKARFLDSEFPACDSSLYYSSTFMPDVASALGQQSVTIEWKRPSELVASPLFISGGASRFDIDQGALGDCWLLASIGALCMHDDLFTKVVDENQNQNFSTGLFHFRFWHFGDWVDVCVDDQLPTVNGQLIFVQARQSKNEFWSALFEKAYAKLNGSYEALRGGSECEAMEDFTGGIALQYTLRAKTPVNFFDTLLKASSKCSLLGSSIDGDLQNPVQPNGLVVGHAYSVTGVRYVEQKQGARSVRVPLVRVRNPWGNATEWNGAWSDNSNEWNSVQPDVRQQLMIKEPNGEWWMSFTDWANNFDSCTVCHLGPDSLDAGSNMAAQRELWHQVIIHGEWVPKVSAGGCANNPDTFWTNPQYHFTVPSIQQSSSGSSAEPNVCIGLMQVDRRRLRAQGLNFLTIGFLVYKLTGNEPPGPLPAAFFGQRWCAPQTPQFIDAREVVSRENLAPGDYVLVPSTFQPDVAGKFVIRIYTEFQVSACAKDEITGVNIPQPSQLPAARGAAQPPALPPKVQVPNAINPLPSASVSPQLQPAELAKLDGPIKDIFVRLARDEGDDKGNIDAWTLQKLLNTTYRKVIDFPFDGFTIETCRSLVSLLDIQQSGRLGFPEFKKLWCELRNFNSVFSALDDKKTGRLTAQQLRQAFKTLGTNLSNTIFHAVVMRYCDSRRGDIQFDDFVLCAARIRTALETFQTMATDGKTVVFSPDNYVQAVVYS